jgi:threonine aldolase
MKFYRKIFCFFVKGDDVFGDDYTVKELEEKCAHILGKEAGLFVPSGTMGNLICVLTHCHGRGEEFIVGDQAHIYLSEQGGSAAIGGVHPRVLPTQEDATLDLKAIESAIRPTNDPHQPLTRLVCLENTHNRRGGRVLSVEYTDQVSELCKKHNLKLHIDGARLFNAATYLNVEPKMLVRGADSVSVCISKGLGAPIGSVIVGTTQFIAEARRLRKALGGGMRQVGVLAAPGLIALEKMSQRLHIDHENAKRLALGIVSLKDKGIYVNPDNVQTNIVIFSFNRKDMTAEEFCKKANERGVRILPFAGGIRACLHHHITSEDVDYALQQFRAIL